MQTRSFRNKMIAGALAPLVIAGALQALYSVVSQRREAVAGLEAKAHALTSLLVNVAGPSIALDDPGGVDEGLGFIEHDPDFEFALAVTPDGKPIAFRGPAATRDARIAAAAITGEPSVSHSDELVVASYPVVIKGRPIAQLVVGLRTTNASAQAAKLTAWAALISIAGIAVAVAVVLILAGRIARRNREMQNLLDNMDQGFLSMQRDGTLAAERSAMATRLLGEYRPGQRLWEAIAPRNPNTAAWLELCWAAVLEGELPHAVTLDQLPGRLTIGDCSYRIEYKPTIVNEVIGDTLLVITDKTAELARERAEASERDLLRMVERLTRDRTGFAEFVDDTNRLIHQLDRASDPITDMLRRDLHTLKGNCGMFGLTQIAERCHELEERLAITSRLDGNVVHAIVQNWGELKTKLDRVFGARQTVGSEIQPDDLTELQAAIARGASLGMIEYIVRSWTLERTRPRLERFAEQAHGLTSRLGKGDVAVKIADHGVRLDATRFRPFWTAFSHAVRNAIDHGIEEPSARVVAGKPEFGHIQLSTQFQDNTVVIEVRDDGRGIDWETVRARARDASLPHETHDELVAALLSDGITTRTDVTPTSGRGVGLSALREACAGAGGRIEIESERGRGTQLRCKFELERQEWMTARLPHDFGAAPAVG